MCLKMLLVLICSSFLIINSQEINPQRNLSSGQIEGYLITSKNGAQGFGFLGIPYAEPPLGKLRFRNPVPPRPWNGVVSCKKYKSNCWQIHTTLANEKFTGIEDCLYLNVITGLECSRENSCPVLFYIHGGGWEYDTPAAFSPELVTENFASRGLVVVTLAYRLNVFGFWSTGSEEALGNYGVYDIIAGLKWVQHEIMNFGGDPNKVTIMGHSSGGFAVSILSVSPATRGLFHQGIMMSGNGVDDSVMKNDLTIYRLVASAVGCANDSMRPWRDWALDKKRRLVVDCMRAVDMDVLGNAFLKVKAATGGAAGPRNDGPGGVFPRSLSQLIADRRPMPAITGTTKRESGFSLPSYVNFTAFDVAGLCLSSVKSRGYQNVEAIALECQRHYVWPFLNRTDKNSTFGFWAVQSERLSSSTYYSSSYEEALTLIQKGAPVYLYSFDYEKSGQEEITPYHSFDLTYLLGVHAFPFDDRDEDIKNIYAALFANFVKYGDPTPNVDNCISGERWISLNPFDFNYYSVDLPQASMKDDYHKEDIIFWNVEAPLLENERSKSRNGLGLLGKTQSRSGSDSLSDWQTAFWVILSVLIAVVFATMALLTRFVYVSRVHAEKPAEEVPLLARVNKADDDSYQTFY